MDYNQATAKLKLVKQEHLLSDWEALSSSQKQALLNQIEKLDLSTYNRQKALLDPNHLKNGNLGIKEGYVHPSKTYDPWLDYAVSGNFQDVQAGKEILKKNQVGALIIAGGLGSRLRFDGPKGLYPVSLIKQKSLFQLFAEKTIAAGNQVQCQLQLAIMTSQLHFEIVQNFFKDHHFFGLKPEQVSFFAQTNLPFLDLKGDLFLEEKGKIAEGPDGNGSLFKSFVESGIWKKWQRLGISLVNTVLIDNPLADPFDAELIGFQSRQAVEVVAKCTFRKSQEERVGLFVKNEGLPEVVEYTEISREELAARQEDGSFKHRCANLSLFCFAMDFIRRVAEHDEALPLHPSLKAVKYLSKEGVVSSQEMPGAWKFEKFIFDALKSARGLRLLVYPREHCFSPLKNLAGDDSLTTVQAALLSQDKQVFKKITGSEVPAGYHFELAQDFHYPTEELLARWNHSVFPNLNYIEP